MANVNVNPGDLISAADSYAALAARAAQISPQAGEEIQRIAATHGPMGYPVAVGIAARLAEREGPLMAKVTDFGTYSQRFTEHAAAYTGADARGAAQIRAVDFTTETPRTPGNGAAVPLDNNSPKDSNKPGWNIGDPRHSPWVAGPNGPRPPQGPGAPRWIEIGPGSGTYVRADEVPGAIIKNPGELGPSPFYDDSGNPVIYVELGPNTGVWAPITDFPGAQFPPPHTFGPPGTSEYIPGSGVWVPRDSLIPEPLAPQPVPPRTVNSGAPH
ncbi:type VII secretion target [Mycobacterium paragordonae]|uniref:Type VII secretion target n=1 Tax=Mycobacterium paragordonae TaxID=1389713 RepID=A0AAJ1W6B9_9MYCO|nr:type VII secretion target [Mycobacterium paragordonae]MBI2699679.1 hypothetical protein [Mycobacterium sp.]MDP7739276.1 type VII secretion target [Mycobacterium paragordonae]TDK94656.1 hypothetical protein EI067_18620 [Mycobacterium paragordonae]TDL04054.1 hypothetical protein EUA05_22640 [Mycobacterium paragordonae]